MRDVAARIVHERVVRHAADSRLRQPVRRRRIEVVRHAVIRRHVAGLGLQVAAQVVFERHRPARGRGVRDIRLRPCQTVQVVVVELLLALGPAPRRPRDTPLERAVAAPGVGVVLDRRRVQRRVDPRQPSQFVVGPFGPHAVAVTLRLRLAVGRLRRHIDQHCRAVLQLRRRLRKDGSAGQASRNDGRMEPVLKRPRSPGGRRHPCRGPAIRRSMAIRSESTQTHTASDNSPNGKPQHRQAASLPESAAARTRAFGGPFRGRCTRRQLPALPRLAGQPR